MGATVKRWIGRYAGAVALLLTAVVGSQAWLWPQVWWEQHRARGLTAEELIAGLNAPDSWIAGKRLAEMGEDAED